MKICYFNSKGFQKVSQFLFSWYCKKKKKSMCHFVQKKKCEYHRTDTHRHTHKIFFDLEHQLNSIYERAPDAPPSNKKFTDFLPCYVLLWESDIMAH